MKVFGSLCFEHVPDQLRKKLDDKSQPMIMVGYHSTVAYKLFAPKNKKIVFSKDVKFDESKGCHWKSKASDKNDSMFYLSDPESEADGTEAEEQIENVEVTNEGGASMPTRRVQPPARLNDYERFPHSAINDEGDIV